MAAANGRRLAAAGVYDLRVADPCLVARSRGGVCRIENLGGVVRRAYEEAGGVVASLGGLGAQACVY